MKTLLVVLMVFAMLAAAVLAANALSIPDPDSVQLIYVKNTHTGNSDAGGALSWQVGSHHNVKFELDVVLPSDLNALKAQLGASVTLVKINKRLKAGLVLSNELTYYLGWQLN